MREEGEIAQGKTQRRIQGKIDSKVQSKTKTTSNKLAQGRGQADAKPVCCRSGRWEEMRTGRGEGKLIN